MLKGVMQSTILQGMPLLVPQSLHNDDASNESV